MSTTIQPADVLTPTEAMTYLRISRGTSSNSCGRKFCLGSRYLSGRRSYRVPLSSGFCNPSHKRKGPAACTRATGPKF